MCGIHLGVWDDSCCRHCQSLQQQRDASLYLKRRGPDAYDEISFTVPLKDYENASTRSISLQASVLQMRQDLVEQPLVFETSSSDTYYLCWNGEVYQATQDDQAGDFGTSDTRLVATRLAKVMSTASDNDATAIHIASVMSGLYNAEFAFLLLQSNGGIFFGRDAWGRRSLLRWDCKDCQSFQIASTANGACHQLVEGTTRQDEEGVTSGNMVWNEIQPGSIHAMTAGRRNGPSVAIPVVDPPMPTPSSSLVLDSLPTPSNVSDDLWRASLELEFHLSNAVKRRMGHNAPTAVLFSGGLDSAVVAALAARHCDAVLYLYNVSFGPSFDKSADRQAALVTHQRLQGQYPDKKIIFQDIVVDWQDICRHEQHIRTILQPKETLMDVNIATALWFASGGGSEVMATTNSAVEDNAERPRVLLLGMGADELLGGYGRHRKAFERGGWDELQKELKLDQARFWERNLGRDDRIVADHGREARFPFLDSHVTRYLQGLPLSLICDFALPPGQGDKRILRLVATRLGLDHASGLVKRAIQFGSRISHLSDAKRFGSRRKAKGEAAV